MFKLRVFMLRAAAVLLLAFCSSPGIAADDPTLTTPLTADAIMAGVAANQDRSDKLRSEYVYHQHIHIVSQKTNGIQMHEESADYLVTPTPDGTKKELKGVQGHYYHKGRHLALGCPGAGLRKYGWRHGSRLSRGSGRRSIEGRARE